MDRCETPYDCYISLGANLGNRKETLLSALRTLSAVDGVKVIKVSSLYETEPWGNTDQPVFLNAVAQLEVDIQPLELLGELQKIENDSGRVRREHWGARTLDLDIIHIPGYYSDTDILLLPHPYCLERAFVLVPWCEISPELCVNGKKIKEHCIAVEGKDGVKLFSDFSN